MDINRFTEKVQQALSAAQTKAVRYGHQQIDVEHLLAALLDQERGLATAIFTKADVDTFLSESSRAQFSYRLLIATTNHVGSTARRPPVR